MVNCSISPEPGETADSLIRRFRKATDRANVYRDYARSREFTAKPQKRAAKAEKARGRRAKANGA
jgi:ribosomal protein S21